MGEQATVWRMHAHDRDGTFYDLGPAPGLSSTDSTTPSSPSRCGSSPTTTRPARLGGTDE